MQNNLQRKEVEKYFVTLVVEFFVSNYFITLDTRVYLVFRLSYNVGLVWNGDNKNTKEMH